MKVIGWQVVAMTLVVMVGIAVLQVSSARAKQLRQEAEMTQDMAKLTRMVTDCLPTESAKDVKELLGDLVKMGVDAARHEIDRESRYRRYRSEKPKAAPKKPYYYDKKKVDTKKKAVKHKW